MNIQAEQLHSEILEMFRRVIGAPSATSESNFFVLGGQSLQASRLIADVAAKYKTILPLRAFFDNPTVRGIVQALSTQEEAHCRAEDFSHILSGADSTIQNQYAPFPLNEVQHAYWIGRSSFFEMGNVATHVYVEFDNPTLDLPRFEAAWNQVIARHDMLRAIITADGHQQILAEFPYYCIAVHDCTALEADGAIAEQQRIRERMSHQILDIGQPLYQLVASVTPAGCRLHCSLDLIIADLWSTQILFKELKFFYETPDGTLPPLKFTFRDYVLAEAKLQHTDTYEQAKLFWQARIETLPKGPDLPIAKKPAQIKQPYFTRRTSAVSADKWALLKRLAAHNGLTPSGLLAAAYAEVLALWSGCDHFTINLTLFNRLPIHSDVSNIVGDFTTLSLLEVQHRPHRRFLDRATALQSQLWEDLDHRYYSGLKVIRDFMKHHGSTEGMFPVVFTSALVHGDSESTNFIGEQVYGISQTPQIWLDHQVFEEAGRLVFNWDAVEELFPPRMLDDMFHAYTQLLEQLAHDPGAISSEALVRLPSWQTELMAHVNDTRAPLAQTTLYHLFERQAAQSPHATAVVADDATLTYADLLRQVRAVARTLTRQGAGQGDLIPVMMHKGWQQVVAVYAIHCVGAAYVPIDPSLPLERRHYLCQQTNARLVLTVPDLLEQLQLPESIAAIAVRRQDHAHSADEADSEARCAPDDLAYVIFTSGSTGQPKGVMIDHRGAVNTILDLNRKLDLRATDAMLALSSLSFDLSVYDIFGLLAVGAKVVMPPHADIREPKRWLDLLARENVTLWNSVPALMAMLLEYKEAVDTDAALPLRTALLSGDWVPVALPDKVRRHAPQCAVMSLGGATEASIWSIYYPTEHLDPSLPSIPYGFPMANQYFRVLDKNRCDCPIWVPGELYIGGVGVAKGYLGDPDKTRASFVGLANNVPVLYKTGDIGRYLPSGAIEFLGRRDNQVKVGGHRIELGEIEAILSRYPGVQDAVVTVCNDERGTKKLCGYIIASLAKSADIYQCLAAPDGWVERVSARLAAVGERSAQEAQEAQRPLALEQWRELYDELDHLIGQQYAKTLHDLDVFRTPGETLSVEQVVERTGVIPRYERWLRRALAVLVEDGRLHFDGNTYSNPAPLCGDALVPQWQALMDKAAQRNVPTGGLAFAYKSAVNLAAAIVGQQEAVSFLFDDGDSGQAVQMYEDEFEYCNAILRELVAEYVNAWPQERKLRILEVGAGIGSSTRHVLPVLDGVDVEYCYTDISKFFLSFGKDEFSEYPFVQYRLLDIEHDPTLQGFERHHYDIIVAASVLHATKDIDETLRNIQGLLAPGGAFFLIEETRFPRIFNLTMGLQQGFDRFVDPDLRAMHPLLGYDTWAEQLAQKGFTALRRYVDRHTSAGFLGLEVMSCHGPSPVGTLREGELLAHLTEHLPEYMVPDKIVEIGSLPLSGNGKLQRDKLPSPWAERQEQRSIVLPHTPLEKKVCAIFEQVLSVVPIGVDDNFFDLGGDSLLATKAVAKIRAEFGVELTIRTIFEMPTVAAIVRKMESSNAVARATKEYLGT